MIVPDDQLSLAIGREGQNARLAARLTGWRIDIRSETEFAAEEAEHGYEEEDAQGRCAAILSNGRRCPNAALPGLALLRDRGPPGAGRQGHRPGRAQVAGRRRRRGAGRRRARRRSRRTLESRMRRKRVHEIAKERGLPAKDVLDRAARWAGNERQGGLAERSTTRPPAKALLGSGDAARSQPPTTACGDAGRLRRRSPGTAADATATPAPRRPTPRRRARAPAPAPRAPAHLRPKRGRRPACAADGAGAPARAGRRPSPRASASAPPVTRFRASGRPATPAAAAAS